MSVVPVDVSSVENVVSVVVPSTSAPGHLERLARYDERARLRLPLFEDGPPEPEQTVPECWGCGVLAPSATWVVRHGWASRPVTSGIDRSKFETYCPACFAEWGWPDGTGG